MLQAFANHHPEIASTARLAQSAVLVGQVTVEEHVNIWYGAVLRGDNAPIFVGAGSNVQENAVLHCDADFPLHVGRDVTVGHGAILHSCTVEDTCLVGMGAILLNGCVIGAGSLVAAGALVTQNMQIPPGSLVVGSPARVLRPLSPEELQALDDSAREYRHLAAGQLPLAGEAE
jgi:carbonic anhydrase/acetyltransferase-like protein (isoleucine patch superfamily)